MRGEVRYSLVSILFGSCQGDPLEREVGRLVTDVRYLGIHVRKSVDLLVGLDVSLCSPGT